MDATRVRLLATAAFALLASTAATWAQDAQGIETRSGAVVLYGNTTRTTQPAQIDYKKVRAKTPEWKTIRSKGVQPGSARYSLLTSAMAKRIRDACRKVAEDSGRDCVVRKGDVKDANGLTVVDITGEVTQRLAK